jgi:hypothetical protein
LTSIFQSSSTVETYADLRTPSHGWSTTRRDGPIVCWAT